jgi:hypothetical protein
MKLTLAVYIVTMGLLTSIALGQVEGMWLPGLVYNHMKDPKGIRSKVEIEKKQNPFYLRGDFDGDNQPDYAVAVRDRKTRRLGVLIFTAKGKTFMLGANNPQKVSDFPNDDFVSSNWMVYTKQESAEVYNPDTGVHIISFPPKGESIVMVHNEGATCLIYWDGEKFKWGCGTRD